jgi:secondary thiamine-phosphate synthase enzyme
MKQFTIKTTQRCQMLNVTDQVVRILKEDAGDAVAVLITVPHTTAAVTVNECADPDVAADMMDYLTKLVPQSSKFRHCEGNSDAHIKATLTGNSEMIPVVDGKLALGTWQGIFFTEYDGPRTRKVCVTLLH